MGGGINDSALAVSEAHRGATKRSDVSKTQREAKRLAQASIETIVIFGVSTLIVLILLGAGLNSQASTSDALRISQARYAVTELTSVAEEVWSQGAGASAKVIITVPSEVNQSESGILNGKTVRYRVLTRADFTDVSEVSAVNITGVLPTIGGQYEVILTARDFDVLMITTKSLTVTTNAESYCETNNLQYYVNAFDEAGQPMSIPITIQLIDSTGIIRGEHNKTTIGGLANGSFSIPSVSVYGFWKVYAFTNETVNFKNILIMQCGNGTGPAITIINCTANATILRGLEASKLSCRVTGTNFIESVRFLVTGSYYNAIQELNNYWGSTVTCGLNEELNHEWTESWANDTTGYEYTSFDSLPVTIMCDSKNPVINSTRANKTSVNVNEYICINTTATDLNLASVWAELTSPSNNKINLTLIDTGSCAGTSGDSIYGALIQLTEEGIYFVNKGIANDTFGNYAENAVSIQINAGTNCSMKNWTVNTELLFSYGNYTNTIFTNGSVTLSGNNLTGTYTSRVFNSHGNSTWNYIVWTEGALYGKQNEVSEETKILELSLDEKTGNVFYDTSGYGHNATLVGTALLNQTGKIGSSIYLNNIDRTTANYLTVPHNSLLNLNVSGGTICAWLNIIDKTQYRGGIVHKGENSSYVDEEYSLQFYGATGTALPAFVIRDSALVEHTVYSSIELTTGKWQQVCTTYNTSVMKIYIDGVERGSVSLSAFTPILGNGSLQIGAQTRYTQVSGIKGYIDEVNMWKRGLNSSEIKEVYTSGAVKLNLTYRACNDELCAGEPWSAESINSTHTTINLTGQYFQYKVNFYTDNATIKPLLFNTSTNYLACNIDYNEENQTCLYNEDCLSGYCRQDFVNEDNWYCVIDSTSCTEEGTSRNNGYKACMSELVEIVCDNGVWTNETDCLSYQGCNTNSTKATYCGWQEIGGTCASGTGCGAPVPGTCYDCESYYTNYPFNACQFTTGITYCDKGCGALCDNSTDYYFNDPGDQCSYGCNNSCTYTNTVTCADPGDLYANTCYYGTNGCSYTGCTTSSEECPNYCINDFDGDTCAVTTRTDPSSAQTCYYNRQCLTSGCNLSSAGALRINYCDYCSLSGTVSGDYSPALNATCASNCPNSGVRYYDDTVTRSDDCLNGAEQILTESYQTGYVYTSQIAAGICSNTECDLDCGAGYVGTCISSTCTCSVETINYTVFFEDFTPSPYYNYNWTRLGTNWDSLSGGTCYGGSGSCAHADGTCTEAGDNIQTITSLIDLTGANNAYFEFYVREDTSLIITTGSESGATLEVRGIIFTKRTQETGLAKERGEIG